MLNKLKKYLKKYLQTLRDNHFKYTYIDKVIYSKELARMIINNNKFNFIVIDKTNTTTVITYNCDHKGFELYNIETPRNIYYTKELKPNLWFRVLDIVE